MALNVRTIANRIMVPTDPDMSLLQSLNVLAVVTGEHDIHW